MSPKSAVIQAHNINESDLYRKWLHKKSGVVYWIDYVAYNEKTLEPMVVYRSAKGDGMIWARPASEFFDGRFELITEG